MTQYGSVFFLAIFGIFWCGLTFFFDAAFVWNLTRQLRASSYPVVTGEVTHSEVDVEIDGEGSSYKVDVHYRYAVDGNFYEGQFVRYDLMSMNQKRADEIVRRYPVGHRVTVHYNPRAPIDAVLELGADLGNYYAAIFMAPFNAVALFIVGGLLGWLRSRQLRRPIAGISQRSDGLMTVVRIYDRSPLASALAAWGGAGFLATFGVWFASWAMPFEWAIALGWSAMLAATFAGWWYARKKYSEFRLDPLRGKIEIRDTSGHTYSLDRECVSPVNYTRKTTTDSDGDKTVRYPLELTHLDPASQQPRILALPQQTTEEDAQTFAAWLNDLLQTCGHQLNRK